MAERDILFAVKNSFYIGAYNNAINEASDMEGLSEAEQTERDVFVYRSYIALGSYDVSFRAHQAVLHMHTLPYWLADVLVGKFITAACHQ